MTAFFVILERERVQMERAFAEIVESWLREEEGYRRFMYLDTVGVPTIGYGRNLKDVGINPVEAGVLLRNDMQSALMVAESFRWFNALSDLRKAVITDMIFNMGRLRFKLFKKMILAVAAKDYSGAAREMLDSKWAKQVGDRANKLAYVMVNDKERPRER